MLLAKQIKKLTNEFASRKPLRAGSLIISVFGDSICQHGNSVWLGSLIQALQAFGINARQIRTAVFRLVQEDWLMSSQHGRKSYYSFTDSGFRHYEKAARRIYSTGEKTWNKKWTIVIPLHIPNEKKDVLKKELNWQGFGSFSSSLFAHPTAARKSVEETLEEIGVVDQLIVFEGKTTDLTAQANSKSFSELCWDFPAIEQRYAKFIQQFKPVAQALTNANSIEPYQGFLLRTLLIHEYRRILLHDADLPNELLPENWLGKTAAELTAKIYGSIQQTAADYIMSEMENREGKLPTAKRRYYTRFAKR